MKAAHHITVTAKRGRAPAPVISSWACTCGAGDGDDFADHETVTQSKVAAHELATAGAKQGGR